MHNPSETKNKVTCFWLVSHLHASALQGLQWHFGTARPSSQLWSAMQWKSAIGNVDPIAQNTLHANLLNPRRYVLAALLFHTHFFAAFYHSIQNSRHPSVAAAHLMRSFCQKMNFATLKRRRIVSLWSGTRAENVSACVAQCWQGRAVHGTHSARSSEPSISASVSEWPETNQLVVASQQNLVGSQWFQ